MSSPLLITLLLFAVGYVLHGLLLAGLVWTLEKLPPAIRLQSPAWRELLWRVVLLAPLCTVTLQMQSGWQPLMGVMTPDWIAAASPQQIHAVETPQTWANTPVTTPAVDQFDDSPIAITENRVTNAPSPDSPKTLSELTPVFGDQPSSAWQPTGKVMATALLFILWLSGTTFLLIRLTRQRRQLQQLRRSAQPIANVDLQCGLQQLLNRNTNLQEPCLLHHPAIQGPATLPRKTICLPLWVNELNVDQQQAMLAHELGHIQRSDVAWLYMGALLQAVFWPQLLLPLARKRLMVLAEIQADSVARDLLHNNGRQLAECLTHCAERIHNHFKPGQYMPGLAVAMSHPNDHLGKQPNGTLTERVRRLISIQPSSSEVSMSKKMTVIVSVMALALVLPAINVMAENDSRHRSVHVIDDDNGHTSMKLSIKDDDGRELKLKAEGDIKFTGDDAGIKSMDEGDEFSLTETIDGVTRKLVAEGETGQVIDYQYSVDGDSQPFDNEAKAWLAETLPDLLSESAINAEGRIAHILAADGHDGVIKRIHRIEGDHALGKHIEAYAGIGLLEDEELDDVLVEVKRIGSDYGQRNALIVIKEKQVDGDANVHVGENVEVDGQRVIKRKRLHKIVGASEGIDSDYEVRSLLEEISKDIDIDVDGAEVHRIVLHRAGDIDSDYELRQTLSGMADAAARDKQVAEVWLETAEKLDSDFELRQALEQLAHAKPEQQSTWVGMLKLAERFDSDYECATFLTTAASSMPRNSDTEAAYRAVLENIDSDYERDRARRALG